MRRHDMKFASDDRKPRGDEKLDGKTFVFPIKKKKHNMKWIVRRLRIFL